MAAKYTVKIQSWYEVSEWQNGGDDKDDLDRIPGCIDLHKDYDSKTLNMA